MEKAETNSGFENITDQLPDYLKMYEIPGQDPITKHSFDRYQADKEQDPNICEQQTRSLTAITRRVRAVPDFERTKIICDELNNPNIHIQEEIMKEVGLAPEEDRLFLIRIGLESSNPKVRKYSIELIRTIPEEKRATIIKECLESFGTENLDDISSVVNWIPEKQKTELLKIIFEKIKTGLESTEQSIQENAVLALKWIPDEFKFPIIKKGVEDAGYDQLPNYAYIINWIRDEKRDQLKKILFNRVKTGLRDPDLQIQVTAIKLAQYVLNIQKVGLIKQGLESQNYDVQLEAAKMIWQVSEQDSRDLAEQGLNCSNISVQIEAAKVIDHIPQAKATFLRKRVLAKIKSGLNSLEAEKQQQVIPLIEWIPKENKKELLDMITSKGLGNELIKPPLYNKQNISGTDFSRRDFGKTGSGTTLLGGELKNNTIIRHIEPEPFLVWQKLFENYELWREAGFDYVPVEPIQSYRLNDQNVVDVYCGVLDLSLDEWLRKTGLFSDELSRQRNIIVKILNDKKIYHGHTHDGNFCLRFYRNEKGEPDFTRLPRLYLIDFDRATFLEENKAIYPK